MNPATGVGGAPGATGPRAASGAPNTQPDPSNPLAAAAPILDYDAHYRTHDATAAQLMVDLQWLRRERRFPEIERAIQAYLKYHSKRAEAWMYLLLAVAFEVNGRSADTVTQALGWAGYLARIQGDPFTLIEVADVMMIRQRYEIPLPGDRPAVGPGELLDLAAEKAPARPEPILLSLLLAESTLDPDRMADAVTKLFSLGWPGAEEQWRAEARRKVEEMAKRLEQESRSAEAQALRDRVHQADQRDLLIRLTWEGDAGYELVVEEPLGATATSVDPRTVFGGAVVKVGNGKAPEGLYVCPLGFNGNYKVRALTLYSNPEDPGRDLKVEVIKHEGTPAEATETHSIVPDAEKPLLVTLEAGRRKQALPFSAPTRLRLVPEVEDGLSPGQQGGSGSSPVVQPPDAAGAADLLRAPSGAKPEPGKIRLEPPGTDGSRRP